ncbi:hypothetical protein M1506_00355 [Patescibacteria group bacterium]|nr:hypothetical protein [Patescibacteria group bacterium]
MTPDFKDIDREFDEMDMDGNTDSKPETFGVIMRAKNLEWLHSKLSAAHQKGVEEGLKENVENWGFYNLVWAVNQILNIIYPRDIFDGSSGGLGPKFTAKLHEAMDVLPEEAKQKGLPPEIKKQ